MDAAKIQDAFDALRAVIDASANLTDDQKATAHGACDTIADALPDIDDGEADEYESPILRALNENPAAVLAALSGLGSYLNNREERAAFGAKMAERQLTLLERIVAKTLDLPPSAYDALMNGGASWEACVSRGPKGSTGVPARFDTPGTPGMSTEEKHVYIKHLADLVGVKIAILTDDPTPDPDKPTEG